MSDDMDLRWPRRIIEVVLDRVDDEAEIQADARLLGVGLTRDMTTYMESPERITIWYEVIPHIEPSLRRYVVLHSGDTSITPAMQHLGTVVMGGRARHVYEVYR